MDLSTFNIIAIIAIAFLSLMLVLALFEPGLPYKISRTPSVPLDPQEFLRMIEALADAHARRKTRIDVLTNGEVFYEAELEAIRAVRHSINLEAYIFQKGEVARDMARSRAITYDEWRRRPVFERAHELLGWILERQQ